MKKYSPKAGDLVKILEQNKYGKYVRSKNYDSPCIFIDRSMPKQYVLQAVNQNAWYKVLIIAKGEYEWFDEPYWRIAKL
jgi:hypothetical protein